MIKGTVVRFDRIKGYGFAVPDTGGGDVFLHVNDLISGDKSQLAEGSVIEFVLEQGERGPKASKVTVVEPAPSPAAYAPARQHRPDADGEDDCDVLTSGEFDHEVTEALLTANPALTGLQIIGARKVLLRFAEAHGWIDN